jgi:ribosomal protein S18 acetylase RimI-like enzyme
VWTQVYCSPVPHGGLSVPLRHSQTLCPKHRMIDNEDIGLAKIGDAIRIAGMSRELIEYGLGWSWTPSRVAREINDKATNVIVTREANEVIGFAVMKYLDQEARLNLFGVHPDYRRRGIGTRMISWLEKTALVNGNGVVYLETRLKNQSARQFYKSLGYKIVNRIPGYYQGKETAVQMGHDLWSDVALT